MSQALPGVHLCKKHQGNHSHYANENCLVCKMAAVITKMLEEEGAEGFTHSLKAEAQSVVLESRKP